MSTQTQEFNRLAWADLVGTINGTVERVPHFNHLGHMFMVWLTCGLWLPVYYRCYRKSDRYRYQRTKYARMHMQAQINANRRK